MHLYPAPTSLRVNRQTLACEASEVYLAAELSTPLLPLLKEVLMAVGERYEHRLEVTASPARKSSAFICMECQLDLGAEAYEIHAAAGHIRIRCGAAQGGFYALHTLKQVVAQASGPLPSFSIKDAPAFAHRGIMLDISRCKVPTMDTLHRLVEKMASMKLNQLQLYTEHTFAFQNHAEVWSNASPMTAEELLELDTFCQRHFIELVPNFNSFGHWERWLKHERYKDYANCPEGFTNSWGTNYPHGAMLKPNRASLKILDELFAEFLPNFSSLQFNAGCDETFELGSGWSKGVCDRKGKYRVYVDFLQKINRLAEKNGRRMQFWGDIILKEPGMIRELPVNSTALAWGYEADHPFAANCKAFQAAGLPYYVCPGTSSWNSITGRTENALENLRAAATQGSAHGASGYLITDWGDNGHHQTLPISYLGFAAGACNAWNPTGGSDPIKAANQGWFKDPTGASAEIFAELGRLLDPIKLPFANSSPFHHLFFHQKPAHEKLLRMPKRELKTSLRRLDALEGRVAEIRGEERALVRKEFKLAVKMTRLALARGMAVQDDPLKEPPRLKQQLQSIEKQHRACWLARNRPGGLKESCNWFRRITKK